MSGSQRDTTGSSSRLSSGRGSGLRDGADRQGYETYVREPAPRVRRESGAEDPRNAAPTRPGSRRAEEQTGVRSSLRDRGAVRDLPEAIIPDGAPSWMGRRAPANRRQAVSRPTSAYESGSAYDPDDYRDRAAGGPDDRPERGTWPERRRRTTPLAERVAAERAPADRTEFEAASRSRLVADRDAFAGDDEEAVEKSGAAAPSPRGSRGRASARVARRQLPGLLGDPICQRFVAILVVALIALWAVAAIRISSADSLSLLRLNAEGYPSVIGDRAATWRLPVTATLLGLMSLGAAWLCAPRDLFSARFLLGASLLVQGLLWVAAITLYW